MKVLAVGQFDPCGFHLRHRKYLAAHGVDLRIAVERVYWEEGHVADYVLGRADDEARCAEFAREADLLQFSPVIDQEWTHRAAKLYTPDTRRTGDIADRPFGPIDWETVKAKRVACFHGSDNAHGNAEAYARHYRGKGYAIAATTLDYVHRMEAEYLPAIVDVQWQAERRWKALSMIHCPTNRAACSTQDMIDATNQKGLKVRVSVVTGKTHAEIIAEKQRHHVGFDHLRGAFSINSLENAALGLIPLAGVKPEYRRYLREQGVSLPWPEIETMDDVIDVLRAMAAEPPRLTAKKQESVRAWFWDEWSPDKVASRVAAAYRRMAN